MLNRCSRSGMGAELEVEADSGAGSMPPTVGATPLLLPPSGMPSSSGLSWLCEAAGSCDRLNTA